MTNRTLMELYRWAKSELSALPVDFPDTEALLLCEHFLDIDGRIALTMRAQEVPCAQAVEAFVSAVKQRQMRPLQYILGEWEFCGMSLAVGEGVLVPREDTMALIELTCERLKDNPTPYVLDLCAGSGAVGLGILQYLPNARVVCVELSDDALVYLKKNAEKYGGSRVEIVKADVLDTDTALKIFEDSRFDAVVSNPPYIPTQDIDELSREVRQEPSMALDGGDDGLVFYRVIASEWTALLKPDGCLAVEFGIGQTEDIERIFVRNNLSNIAVKRDFSGIDRAIIGTLTSNAPAEQ